MNDYDEGFYIDEEPPSGSGDEDNDEAREYNNKQIKAREESELQRDIKKYSNKQAI